MIGTPNPPATSPGTICTLGLSSIQDPNTDTGLVLRYAAGKANTGVRHDCTIEILQSGASLPTPIILTDTDIDPTATGFVILSHSLTSGQVAQITNFGALSVVVAGMRVGAGTNRIFRISALELEAPDPTEQLALSAAGQATASLSLTVAGTNPSLTLAAAGQATASLALTVGVLLSLAAAGQATASVAALGRGVPATPLIDMDAGQTYKGYQGGLYPGGSNTIPAQHASDAANQAALIVPRDASGNPDPAGKIGLMAQGFSHPSQEWAGIQTTTVPIVTPNAWSFMGQAAADPAVDTAYLVTVDGAAGAQTTSTWDDEATNYDRVRDDILGPIHGLTEDQVQCIWTKLVTANPTTSLPSGSADAFDLLAQGGDMVRLAKSRYANCALMILSPRSYAGYASGSQNDEPFAYEVAFATKWLIQAQVNQLAGGGIDPVAGDLSLSVAPLLLWGPYLWSQGTTPNGEGMSWAASDYEADNLHPNTAGETKVGAALLDFFKTSPYTAPWFLAATEPLALTTAGQATASLAITVVDPLTLTAAGQATATLTLQVTGGSTEPLTGMAAAGQATATLTLSLVDALALSASGQATASLILTPIDRLTLAATGQATASLALGVNDGTIPPSAILLSDITLTAATLLEVTLSTAALLNVTLDPGE